MQIDVAFKYEGIKCKLRFDYIPERPAPSCSNPDRSAYYDCGDPEEIEFEGVIKNYEVDIIETDKLLQKTGLCQAEIENLVYCDVINEFESLRNERY